MGLRMVSAPSSVDLSAIEQQVADAKSAAVQAAAGAANVRQMIINTNGQVATLAQTAGQVGSIQQAADAVHQTLQDEITALQQQVANVATTPGPKGDPGAKGNPGDKGNQGDVGPSGTANLVIGLKPIGLLALGGNTTLTIPWGRTLTTAPANIQFAHSALVSLANVTYSNVVVTTTGVTVKVTSVGLALAAGTLLAVGY